MVNQIRNNWNLAILEKTINEIISSFNISPDYKLISEINIESLLEEKSIPIHWTCISITLLVAKKLNERWIKSKIIITKDKKWHFHCYLRAWEYIIKWFKIERWLWSERKIFESEYNWESSLYEVFRKDKIAIISFKTADLVNWLLPCSWNLEQIKRDREKRALAMQRILSQKN